MMMHLILYSIESLPEAGWWADYWTFAQSADSYGYPQLGHVHLVVGLLVVSSVWFFKQNARIPPANPCPRG